MLENEKRALTYINKIPLFKGIIKKLTVGIELSDDEKVYILGCAIIFLNHYEKDHRLTSYAEFSYYIVLKYSVFSNDYIPLYDYCSNFGFYPIARAIFDNDLLTQTSVSDYFVDFEIEKFTNDGESYIQTFHQYTVKRALLDDGSLERSYIAPTSFGKSSVIVDCIRALGDGDLRIGIVVPTKSLLMQTYRMVRSANLRRKIIIHDEMYQEEESFIAVFTQERALRLMSKHSLCFDVLFIDEAHNLLKDDPRSVLMSRLLLKNRILNPNQRVIYLSPLVDDVESLKIDATQNIESHKIPFNIKEPEIFEYRLDQRITKYNRFVNEHYDIGSSESLFAYIVEFSSAKNFLYNYRPIAIEDLAKELAGFIPAAEVTDRMAELIHVLRREVHEQFYVIEYISHGIIYIHGKLPDLIKEYLESKFRDLPEITYIIANSVILEGMNLPIDNLYILNTRSLYGKELTNLIGRVNRLNQIFTYGVNNLQKLLPTVHFVNSEKYNRMGSNMSNKINLLRGRTFKDLVENPTLNSFDFESLAIPAENKDRKRAEYERIRSNEAFLNQSEVTPEDRVKQYLIETGIAAFYNNVDEPTSILYQRINVMPSQSNWSSLPMLEKIAVLFINDMPEIKDFEFSRLKYPEARNYYDFHITVSQRRALNQNIVHMLEHFKRLVERDESVAYFGDSYGERARSDDPGPSEPKAYIDLAKKSDPALVNLAIVKLKMEDDFVSFKLNKFIVMMYDYGLISHDDYNLYIYGTTDQNKIDLTKVGLSVSLISRLEEDNQLQYLYFDAYNNLTSRPEFEIYKAQANDFYRFEIERFLN